jgi:hypothetical protein
MIICAKFEDPPKNCGSPGADFVGLCILINFFYIINSVLEIEEEEYIWM